MLKYVVVKFEMSHGHRCLQICQAGLCGGSNSTGFRLSNSMLYKLGWETLHAPCDKSFNKVCSITYPGSPLEILPPLHLNSVGELCIWLELLSPYPVITRN